MIEIWVVARLWAGKIFGVAWSLLGDLARLLAGLFAGAIVGRLAALAAVGLVVALGWQSMQLAGLRKAIDREHRAQRAAAAAAAADTRAHVAKAKVITNEVEHQVVQRQVEIRTVYRDLIKEVPVYVTAEADRRGYVPYGFVRLLDAAAAGRPAPAPVPGSAPGADEAPSGFVLSDVAGSVVGNYETCQVWRSVAEGWQRWYVEQRAAWDEKIPPPATSPP